MGAGVLLSGLLSGCADFFVPHQRKAEHFAVRAGWAFSQIPAPPFTIAGALGPNRGGGAQTLTVYLEGDGMAYLGSRRVSPDPTPDDPVALRMALSHPGGRAAYLARPCQYRMDEACRPALWTSHRYGTEILDALDTALDALKHRAAAERLVLVGYSGGGALAVLLAARRPDVVGIVTVAANLDLATWTRLQGLTPLKGSSDPAGVAAQVAGLAQRHFAGSRDPVVPQAVQDAFLERQGGDARTRLSVVPGYDHGGCWADGWPKLSRDPALATMPGFRDQTSAKE